MERRLYWRYTQAGRLAKYGDELRGWAHPHFDAPTLVPPRCSFKSTTNYFWYRSIAEHGVLRSLSMDSDRMCLGTAPVQPQEY